MSAPASAPATTESLHADPLAKPVPRWAIHRRMYDWTLGFAHRKHSALALFTISFAESSFFPIPPDVLLAPLCMGNRAKSFFFAFVCTLGSVLGALLGYAIGYAFIELALMIPKISQEGIDGLAASFEERGEFYVFIAALTPIPFKLLTITAGFAQMSIPVFLAACVVGRAARFFAVAGLFWWIGPKAGPFIDRWFNWLCVIFTLLLIGGFYAMSLRH